MPVVKVTAEEFKKICGKSTTGLSRLSCRQFKQDAQAFWYQQKRLAALSFHGPIGHECGLFTIRRESKNYTTVGRILEIFGIGNHSAKVARAEARDLVRQPKKLAERVYGLGNPRKSKELGNTEKGDGFNFRGAGFLQITGRDSYTRHGNAIGVDLTENSDLAAEPENSLMLACEEWKEKKVNRLRRRG